MNWNVSSHLERLAREQPERVALHCPERHGHRAITFAALNAEVDRLAHGLAGAGIGPGMRTALMVPPSLDFFALTFALFRVAAVPVFIDPGMGVKHLGRCLADAEPQAFIGVPKAHLARRLLGWARHSLRITVNAGRWRLLCQHSTAEWRMRSPEPYYSPRVDRDQPAAILFTSGSTGIAKGAEYTHGIFTAQVEMLKQIYGIQPGEVDFCTFPLFALFGPALGMTCVIPRMDFSRPARIDAGRAAQDIRHFKASNFFGSPAVLRQFVETLPAESPPLASLRRVISAGAPASPAVLEKFARLLPPGVEVFTPYGATEALPVANLGSHEILAQTRPLTETGHGVCIGRPVDGMQVEIIPVNDEPIAVWEPGLRLPPGQIGEFVVRGPVVTQRYFNNPEATARAKIRDPQSGEILHRMGDVGYRDALGRLWFCGRKSHRVNTPDGPLFTDMIEPIMNKVAGVRRSALVGVERGGAMFPVICLEREGRRLEAEVLADCRAMAEQHPLTRGLRTYLFHPGLPMDVRHNSKIFRERVAAWADRQLGPNWKGP